MNLFEILQDPETQDTTASALEDVAQGVTQGAAEVADSVANQLNVAARLQEWVGEIHWPAVIATLIEIAFIIVLALVANRVLRFFTRRLQKEVEEDNLTRKRQREQRAQTLASLLNNVGAIVIALLATIMALGTFMEIGPLLAGVGVLGLAISFGAQSLVKDLINGAFMLVEGQFAVGDVIRVKGTAGLVEKITLRTIVLRDINGVVHVIPNGTVDMLSNLTKNWSRAVLEIGVAYKEDVDRVLDVMKDEALKLWKDPEWEPLIPEEPTVPGVEQLADSAVVIRVMFTTLPLKQWDVAREYRRRIKKRLDAEGIEIPFPHQTIYWGDGEKP